MKISITNIGPVRSASIDLRPLVLFIGPNNSGKSVVAAAMYASLSQTSVATNPMLMRAHQGRTRESASFSQREANAFIKSIIDGVSHAKRPVYEDIPASIVNFFESQLTRSLREYSFSVLEELTRTTGASPQELRRATGKRPSAAQLAIENDTPPWTVRINIGSMARFEPRLGYSCSNIWSLVDFDFWKRTISYSRRDPEFSESIIREIASELVGISFRRMPEHIRYLPASRSGILHSRRGLAGSLVRRSSLGGVLGQQKLGPPGIVTDFLSEMIEIDPLAIGSFRDEARSLEASVLKGELVFSKEPGPYPEPVYHTNSGDYPLTRTSSMVSELAPLVLYLRYVLHRDEVLIIEEPETSLHPGSQVTLARSLVRLVNKGLRIVVTTHSEFFLEQINHAIIAASMDAKAAAQAGFRPEEVLSSSKVAAYSFEPTPQGTVVNELDIDIVDGISESSFSSISEDLYHEARAIEKGVESGEY